MAQADYEKSGSQSGKRQSFEAISSGNASRDSSSTNSGADIKQLQDDVAKLTETVTQYMQNTRQEAARKVQSVASHMGDAATQAYESGAEMASHATAQAKTFASEIETMARKNPLGAMAGALAAGVLIGLIGRGRS